MAEGIVGQTITERFRTSAAGESFTITNATKPDGTSWSGPTISTISGALYSASFVAAAAGVYKATITGNTSGEVFSAAWDILAASTRSFTRRVDGNTIMAAHVTELQQAIEDLSF
jgi:hypothetical protein